jgi:three-Cys-motif partner protein
VPFPPRDSQTRIKHEILRQYAGTWAGIITSGIRKQMRSGRFRGRFTLDLVYLDAFAGAGVYDGDSAEPPPRSPVWGSPVIATEALMAVSPGSDEFDIRVSTIAIEQHHAEELFEALSSAELGIPVRLADGFDGAARAEATVIAADCRRIIDQILDGLTPHEFLLTLVDPYGDAMSMEQLGRLLGRERTDGITLFPTSEVLKRSGSARKSTGELSPTERINLARTTALFGTDSWMEIARSELDAVESEGAYVDLYENQIRAIDQDLIVKSIRLRFGKLNRTGYHLFLTTRHHDGALRMNDILRAAGIREHWTLWCDRQAQLQRRDGMGLLFELVYRPEDPEEINPDEAANIVRGRLPDVGGTTTWKDLYVAMADEVLGSDEIGRAMTVLKKQRRITFDGRRHWDPIRVLR